MGVQRNGDSSSLWKVQEDIPEEVISLVTPEGWHSGLAEKSSMC